MTQQAQLKQMFKALAANPMQTLQQLVQNGIKPEQVLQAVQQAAEQGDPDAVQAMQAIQKAQQGTQSAKNGAKLQFVKKLNGICPEGYERVFKTFKVGGSVKGCPICQKKAEMNKCGGKAPKKHLSGGVTKTMNTLKEAMKCGGKTPKGQQGLKNTKIEPTDTIHTRKGDKQIDGKPFKVGTPLALTKKAEKAGYKSYPNRGKGLTSKTVIRATNKDIEAGRGGN